MNLNGINLPCHYIFQRRQVEIRFMGISDATSSVLLKCRPGVNEVTGSRDIQHRHLEENRTQTMMSTKYPGDR
jgi:hypothetical protein